MRKAFPWILVVVLSGVLLMGATAQDAPDSPGRYTVVPFITEQPAVAGPGAILLDTQTGETWEYFDPKRKRDGIPTFLWVPIIKN